MKITARISMAAMAAMLFLKLPAFAQEPQMAPPAPDPRTGTIGISIANMSDAYVQQYKLSVKQTGVVVVVVGKGSAGEKAGFKTGDVITGVNKKKVGSTRDFMEERLRFKPGDVLEISGLGAGKAFVRRVKIAPVA